MATDPFTGSKFVVDVTFSVQHFQMGMLSALNTVFQLQHQEVEK